MQPFWKSSDTFSYGAALLVSKCDQELSDKCRMSAIVFTKISLLLLAFNSTLAVMCIVGSNSNEGALNFPLIAKLKQEVCMSNNSFILSIGFLV